ncbi:hypothetical protein [Xanthobacter sp. KR7-225]|uniref:hypothetical protein n=1 Tax=Xanthobacter sp. KR7-225 TaxID=3156613 RepID=UPI0032B348E8
MSDKAPVVHIGENSPEQVAYKLLGAVAHAEGKLVNGLVHAKEKATREWILDTYAECLQATLNHRSLKR